MTAQITALPTPPSTNDPANFNTRADAFLGQMPAFVGEVNALATEVSSNAVAADASKTAAGVSEASAAASANSALNAPGTNGTSTTSLLIGTGTKIFTTQSGKAWSKGQGVVAASSANPLNQMIGIISAYSGTSLTVEIQSVGGSGAFADWIISMAAGSAIAPASQAQAEAGLAQGVYMDALRTAQAINKLAVPQSDAVVTVATTLTITSKFSQAANMALRGAGFTLPAGNSYTAGGPKFAFSNVGSFDLPIRDSAGAIKGFVRPGNTATCYLRDYGSAAGAWSFEGAAIYGETASYYGGGYGGSAVTGMKVVALDSDRDLLTLFTATLIKSVVYVKSTNTWGGWATIAAETVNGSNGLDAQVISSSSVLLTWSSSTSGLMKGVVLSISASTITVNTVATVAYPGTSSQAVRVVPLSGSFIILGSDFTNTNLFCYGASVSGTMVTFSAAATVFSSTTATNYADLAVTVIGSTLVVMSITSSANGFQARAMSISGSTVTLGTNYAVAVSSNTSTFKFTLLANGRIFVCYPSAGVVVARSLGLSGLTITSGTAATGANSVDVGFGYLNIASVGSNKVLISYTNGANQFTQLWSDSSGTITTSSTLNHFLGGTLTGGFKTSVSGASVVFVRNGMGAGAYVQKIDCSGANPVMSDLFLYQTVNSGGVGTFFSNNPNEGTPDDTVQTLMSGSVAFSGSSGIFGLTGITDSYDVLVFNPYAKRLIQDHAGSPTLQFYGKDRTECYYLGAISTAALHIRKFETTN